MRVVYDADLFTLVFFNTNLFRDLKLVDFYFILFKNMGESRDNEYEDELFDYEKDAQTSDSITTKANNEVTKK